MSQTILNLLRTTLGSLKSRQQLLLEILLLKQQLIVLLRHAPKPKFKNSDRLLFAWLSQSCQNWKNFIIIVKPETVIKWHKAGFKIFWKWKSRLRTEIRRKDLIATTMYPARISRLRRTLPNLARSSNLPGAKSLRSPS